MPVASAALAPLPHFQIANMASDPWTEQNERRALSPLRVPCRQLRRRSHWPWRSHTLEVHAEDVQVTESLGTEESGPV